MKAGIRVIRSFDHSIVHDAFKEAVAYQIGSLTLLAASDMTLDISFIRNLLDWADETDSLTRGSFSSHVSICRVESEYLKENLVRCYELRLTHSPNYSYWRCEYERPDRYSEHEERW